MRSDRRTGKGRKSMKRLLLVSVCALAATAFVAGAATAGDTKGPPCANITGREETDYYSPAATPDLRWTFVLGATACDSVTYRLDIYDFAGSNLLVDDLAPTSTVGDRVVFEYTFASGAPSDGVCLVGETTRRGKTADRAPDGTGCFQVAAGSSGAGGGFN
jgi:hypothetical protein